MKKVILVLSFLIIGFASKAQDYSFPTNANGDYEFSEVIESNLSKSALYSNAKAWVVETFGNYKAVVQYESESEGRLVIKGYHEDMKPKIVKDSWFQYESAYFKITIDCKEHKYRYRINDIVLKEVRSYIYSGNDYDSDVTHEEHIRNLKFAQSEKQRAMQELETAKNTLKGNKLRKETERITNIISDNDEEIEYENDMYKAEFLFFDLLSKAIKKRMAVDDDF